VNAEKWTAQFCSQISNILFLKTRWKDNFRSQRNIFKNSLVQEKEETRNRWPYIKMKNYCTWFQVSHSMPIQFQRSRISDNREVPASALTCCLTGLSPIQLPPTDATPAITSTLVSLVAFQKKIFDTFCIPVTFFIFKLICFELWNEIEGKYHAKPTLAVEPKSTRDTL